MRGRELLPLRVEVELDIFSGMPNPTWVLSDAEAVSFVEQLADLPAAAATNLSGNLGYRGFIVKVTQGSGTLLIHIQNGTVHIANDGTDLCTRDDKRKIERWLLNTGKMHVKDEIFKIAVREFGSLSDCPS